MNRREWMARCRRFGRAQAEWETLLKPFVVDLMFMIEPSAREQERYTRLREFWLAELEPFAKDIFDVWRDDVGVNEAVEIFRFVLQRPRVDDFQSVLRGRDTYRPRTSDQVTAQVDALFTRYAAWLDREKPHWLEPVGGAIGRLWNWLTSRPDWIESHPRTLIAFGLAVLAVFAWQFPSILQSMGEFVRALKGN